MLTKLDKPVTNDVWEYYVNEALTAHALMDRVGAPRKTPDGSLLSLAQRLGMVTAVMGKLMAQVGMPLAPLQ